jgi:mannan endo-1,4-beta-mannosidase
MIRRRKNLWIRSTGYLFLCISSFIVSSCSLLPWLQEKDEYIKVQGQHFVYNGKPYFFTGVNVWYPSYLGSTGMTGDRSRLTRELDTMAANGITNLRILAASEWSYIQRSIKPAIQISAGICDDSLLVGLDFTLAEMAKRRMHAVLYLNNYWEWSGGMAQYMVWATGKEGPDPEDPQKGYGPFMDFSAKFYSTSDAVHLYREYVKRIVTRRNRINGRYYNDDPTIMSWQLANEPRPGRDGESGKQNLSVFYQWIDSTAYFIHSLDTNHLVSTGSEGKVGCIQSEEAFLKAHQSSSIDYLTFHLWPLNWGWFNPNRFAETLPASEENALKYIGLHLAFARQLNKPVVMEEFGIGRDNGELLPGTPTSARDHFFKFMFRSIYDSARTGSPIAGSNIWSWGGEASAHHQDGIWRQGDPFTGDPPQEPQGRNSIFTSDTSTLAIIHNHAVQLQQLEIIDTMITHSHER